MNATATLTSYRQSPRKVRLVADLVKGKSVEAALSELRYRSKRAAPVFEKLIRSAVANAKMLGMNEKALMVKDIRVDKGPVMKRSMPRAHGRAFPIHKHTSHIVVSLSSTEALFKKEKKAGKEEKKK
ncbi:MAG: 50S ribosomal protein L22 [Candidatus Lloydbacteria bacterium RIFCSPHIGHO2_02_FULL_54_17]|uniref:Large ribosomal subunit protein uL22 n=1 Tax=Candidatus Lloydbacteria bacterium RIFCSPHIGHO2_02_FULL_54_17 TaxID=1798664 RepID=A0A1G2DFF6_9BACT|nr:MAG: 50S ribosomal protein L22 [Candidatus Lloydbacteria bacterium RIFCSPHIGHO2_01_FULL_54_11]OGZ12162.1 MAG: 50S ribosomal protein L22 [Candidatus Lloydbacteria bacterium RIFCSPHIGHO2_02_FULL_54_17]OGZ12953.1 MAG: 50S ribosomal protein L22 [Candidatus Lloydbacteria bacterium RIFCSPLOWO2_01_FULL_54_18]OGZ15951.1 MAG: 50S ribosomal protein L22 [Candidatus Lloydbacteria bacterium RIFCSPLOWO2_02_FULL_54_12]